MPQLTCFYVAGGILIGDSTTTTKESSTPAALFASSSLFARHSPISAGLLEKSARAIGGSNVEEADAAAIDTRDPPPPPEEQLSRQHQDKQQLDRLLRGISAPVVEVGYDYRPPPVHKDPLRGLFGKRQN